MIERHFEVPFVSRLAMREKQIQQNYRPVIAVHKWFARRPGTLFRSLILSEFANLPIHQTFYQSHRMPDFRVFDPFMGGGTTMMEANRVGCAVAGTDVNPMAWWIVRQEIRELDVAAYQQAAEQLRSHLEAEIGSLYRTRCQRCGNDEARAKYFLWVKTARCGSCHQETDLFPDFLVSEAVRHPTNVFVCGCCGELFEAADRRNPGPCPHCGHVLPSQHTARRNKAACKHCNQPVSYPSASPPAHRLFALEYHCESCGSQSVAGSGKGRLFKKPDAHDLARFAEAETRLGALRPKFIPPDKIPSGDETARLHRWGYECYRDLFNARQLLGLELSCRWIAAIKDERIREALATNLSDLTRYQNMLCRYDTMALKSLDIFSVHGFPVGLIQCESNLLGIAGRKGVPVGSGGWLNIVEKFAKAKRYCGAPFEVRHDGSRKVEVPIPGEWIGTWRNGTHPPEQREVLLLCADSASAQIGGEMFDAVFTDPPYFGNVQYAELMDFCYVWLRKLLGSSFPEFSKPSTRHQNELTGNSDMGRGLDHFTEGISDTIKRSAKRLKPGRPLAFTYHHNQLEAYLPLAVAILDANLVCSASLPCPAEMGASIHINGTGSSVIDTVFVCRSTGSFPRRWLATNATGLAEIIRGDVEMLADGDVKATQGDIKCISCGHLTRLAIWNLRKTWDSKLTVMERLGVIRQWYVGFGGLGAVLAALENHFLQAAQTQRWAPASMVQESHESDDEVSF
jgi:adenine-specific DNA methylase